MVREAMQADRSIAEVGRLYGVNQNQLSRWIREYRDGAAWSNQALVPVELVETSVATSECLDVEVRGAHVPPPSTASATVVFPSGRRVDLTGLDRPLLCALMESLS
jgi:transposase-like protein